MSNLIKSPDPSNSGLSKPDPNSNKLSTRITGKSRLAERIATAAKAGGASTEPPVMPEAPLFGRTTSDRPNRIALLLDCSSSMGSIDSIDSSDTVEKIKHLQDAVIAFGTSCNWFSTAVCFNTFPHSEGYGAKTLLSSDLTSLIMTAGDLKDHGGTPMAESMDEVIRENDITRAILISDGDADRSDKAKETARFFAGHKIPIDCLHIGTSTGGEQLLKEIAEITHGVFIKFDNPASFAKALSFLTPESRPRLFLTGAAAQLGAKELKLK